MGYSVLSVGCLFCFVASLPEIIDSMLLMERLRADDHILNDKASGIFNGFSSFGAILAPILGGFLTDSIGYRYANDSVACFSCLFTLIFVSVYAFGPKPKYPREVSIMSRKLSEEVGGDFVLL